MKSVILVALIALASCRQGNISQDKPAAPPKPDLNTTNTNVTCQPEYAFAEDEWLELVGTTPSRNPQPLRNPTTGERFEATVGTLTSQELANAVEVLERHRAIHVPRGYVVRISSDECWEIQTFADESGTPHGTWAVSRVGHRIADSAPLLFELARAANFLISLHPGHVAATEVARDRAKHIFLGGAPEPILLNRSADQLVGPLEVGIPAAAQGK